MRMTPIQASFAYGEIAPDLYGRVDTPQYAQGVRSLVNMYATAHGALVRRGGFEHKQLVSTGSHGTLIPFPNYASRGAMLILKDDGDIRLYTEAFEDAADPTPNAPPGTGIEGYNYPDPFNQLIQNESFDDDDQSWDFWVRDLSGDNVDPSISIDLANGLCNMKTYAAGHYVWSMPYITQEIALPDESGRYYFRLKTIASTTAGVDPTLIALHISSEKPPKASELPEGASGDEAWLQWWYSNILAYQTFSNDGSAAVHTFSFNAAGHERIWLTVSLGPAVVGEGNAQSSNEYGVGFAAIDEVELREWINRLDPSDTGTIVSGDPHQPVNHMFGDPGSIGTHPYTADQLPWVQYCYTPDEYGVILTHVNHMPMKIYLDIDTGVYHSNTIQLNSSPPEWGTNNYPRCAVFHDNRLWMGGSQKTPFRLWGSKVGDFTRMAVPTTPLDDDPLSFDLNGREQIHWLVSHRNLVIGTDQAEYIITSQGGAITTTDHQLVQQGSTGSHSIQPVKVDDRIMFVSADGHRLYSYGYSDDLGAWRVQEMTINARHLFKSDTIRQIVLDQHPHRIIWARTASGQLMSMTYEDTPQGVVAAWARHTTDGIIRSMASSTGLSVSYLYTLVQRQIWNNNEWWLRLERLSDEEYLDGYVKHSDPAGFQTFGDIQFHAMQWLSVVTRQYNDQYGEIHPRVQVNPVGDITLLYSCREAVFGYPYLSYVETLPIDLGGRESSMSLSQKRFSQVFTRIINSHKPAINGVLAAERRPSDYMNSSPRPRTEDILTTNLGHDKEAIIRIVQDRPYGLYLAGIFGKLHYDTP